MKITTYQQLDELVAKELGYYFKEDKEFYLTEWYSPNKEYIGNFDIEFSTDHSAVQELINHIHSLNLELAVYSNKLNCSTTIYEMDEDFIEVVQFWESTCGSPHTNAAHSTIDSSINSVPLAICLAFLKYKGIEVDLDLKGAT